jgi:hypothetical protein
VGSLTALRAAMNFFGIGQHLGVAGEVGQIADPGVGVLGDVGSRRVGGQGGGGRGQREGDEDQGEVSCCLLSAC